jgi:DNA-binding MarR family transcriptional regulator
MNYSYINQQEQFADKIINDAYRALHLLHHNLVNISSPKLVHHHLAILTMLDQNGSLSASEIARRLSLTKPQMTNFIDILVMEKAVLREDDTSDRRRIIINITETGISILSEYRKLMRDNIIQKIKKLEPEQVTSLTQALEQIISISQKLI